MREPFSTWASSRGHSIGSRVWCFGNIRAHCGSGNHRCGYAGSDYCFGNHAHLGAHCCGYAVTHFGSQFDSQGHGVSGADQNPSA